MFSLFALVYHAKQRNKEQLHTHEHVYGFRKEHKVVETMYGLGEAVRV